METSHHYFTEGVARGLERLVPGLNADRSLVSDWLDQYAETCTDEDAAAYRILKGVTLKVILHLHEVRDMNAMMES